MVRRQKTHGHGTEKKGWDDWSCFSMPMPIPIQACYLGSILGISVRVHGRSSVVGMKQERAALWCICRVQNTKYAALYGVGVATWAPQEATLKHHLQLASRQVSDQTAMVPFQIRPNGQVPGQRAMVGLSDHETMRALILSSALVAYSLGRLKHKCVEAKRLSVLSVCLGEVS